jgi:hypothetical protein
LVNVKHVFVKAAARLNNRAENSHQPTRERERRMMRGFRERKRAQAFLSSLVRSGSTSRSSDACYELPSIANTAPNASLRGIGSPNSPKIRRPFSDRFEIFANARPNTAS